MEEFVQYIIDHFYVGSHEMTLFFLAMLPITELRGAIPVGILFFKLNPVVTYCLCCLGNMVPVIPLVLFFGKIEQWLMRHEFSNRFLQWYIARVRRRTQAIERYEMWGLALFVAIPLPVTGAWTGSVAAFLMGIGWKKACVSIGCGVLIAGVVVTLLTVAGYRFYSFL